MPTASGTSVFLAKGVVKHTWVLSSTATVGRPATMSRFPDKTVSARGTFAGAVVAMLGSNQSATVAQGSLVSEMPLRAPLGTGTIITLSTVGMRAVIENPNLIFPKLTSVSSGSSVTVEMIGRG